MESGEENLKNNKVFEVLQRVGRSFMLPIAILPVAGLFLGIGSSFTNETMLKAYGLYGIMGPGTIIHGILTVMSAAGSIVFDNLPLLFAIGVAIGMAKREKEVAALASVIAFFYYAYCHKCVDFRKLCRRRYEYGCNGTGCCEFGAKSRSERCNVNGTWYIYA